MDAQIQTTGLQFVKNGVAINFLADAANKSIIMKGSQSIPLSISEARLFITMLENLITIVDREDDNGLDFDGNEL